MAVPQSLSLPLPARVPARVPAVPTLLAATFTLLVVGLLALDATASSVTPATPVPVAGATGATSIPVVDVASNYHLRPGDTLDGVAAMHGVDPAHLAAANRLTAPYTLEPGSILAIPVPASPPAELLPGAVSLSPEVRASVERWAEEYRLPPALFAAMTWRESRWRPDALSSRGAIGVGQVLPETAVWVSDHLVGQRLDPWQVEENLQLSAAYLRWLIDRSGGDEAAALAAYHQGRTSVLQDGWFGVTHRYVADVFDLRWRFEAAAAQPAG